MSTRGWKALKEERFPSTMTWSDLMTPGKEDLGWLPKAPAARPHHPAVGEPESKRGNGRGTSPKRFRLSDVAQKSFPIRQNMIRTRIGMDGDSHVHILVNYFGIGN